jgi:outer membrane biosynthesis protein TonB
VDESQAEWDKFAESAKNLDTTKRNIVFIQKNAVDIFSKEEQQQQPDAVGEGAGASKADNASDAGVPPLSEDVGEPATQPVVEEKVEEDKKKKKKTKKEQKKKEQEKKKASGTRDRSDSQSNGSGGRAPSARIALQNSASEKRRKK